MNFVIFLCVTLKLFSLGFVSLLLAPNPGDDSAWNGETGSRYDFLQGRVQGSYPEGDVDES